MMFSYTSLNPSPIEDRGFGPIKAKSTVNFTTRADTTTDDTQTQSVSALNWFLYFTVLGLEEALE